MAYFPRNQFEEPLDITIPELPSKPLTIGPIFDTANVTVPLHSFDQALHAKVYGGPTHTGEAIQPATPTHFKDRYLFPSLARNERVRLTMLWYHSRLAGQDETLRAKIDTLVNGLQQAIGWDYAIAGIIDESTYLRLATARLPILRLPRREATCAHTINQTPGTVFMVNDMSKDWRFKQSPHVEIGGLKSYAGTQLRLLANDGDQVSLGSLCVASDTAQPPLSQMQRNLIVRFAELISSTIASHTRQGRLREREAMSNMLSTLQNHAGMDYERDAILIVQQAYPKALVSLELCRDGMIPVPGQPGFAYTEVHEGLWEDTQSIEEAIKTTNFATLHSTRTIRAAVSRCGRSDKYLMVASADIHHVFDDFDAWFVAKSASIIADTMQARLLQQALEARETFLRGMTHQLRTPIHGILGSVELLAEDLATVRLLGDDSVGSENRSSTSPSECLATIKNSGQELMTTVNNILKHNTWADALRQYEPGPYDLCKLEADILPGILDFFPPEQLKGVSIDFRMEVDEHHCIFFTDPQIFRECVQAIILNAAKAVAGNAFGALSITIRAASDFSWLLIDVVDNGCGIEHANHGRIFEPYEKVDAHKPGAGLGLTLARKMAHMLNGSVQLMSSALGSGSHFRVEFKDPNLTAPSTSFSSPKIASHKPPLKFAQILDGEAPDHLVGHVSGYLVRNGFQGAEPAGASLIVSNSHSKGTLSVIRTMNSNAIIISCGSTALSVADINDPYLITIEGPIHTQKLDHVLQQAERLHQELGRVAIPANGEDFGQDNRLTAEKSKSARPLDIAQLSVHDNPKKTDGLPLATPLKALLVDDNLTNLRVLQMFCHKRRIPCATAEDGNQAYERYKEAVAINEPFTLVLMDLQMPQCTGIQATESIRDLERTSSLERSRIFMVTGQDSANDRITSKSAGADEFLVKPVGPRDLDRYIKTYFETYNRGK